MKCLNCGKKVSERAKYCGDACRKAFARKSDTNPDKSVAEVGQKAKSDTKNVRVGWSLFGRKHEDISSKDEFRLGNEIWGQVFTKETMPWWMFDGEMETGIVRGNPKMVLTAEDRRRRFRNLMLEYDVRFGARDSHNELIGG